jgi:hypothetical protein
LSFLNRKFPILFLSFILLACESQRPQEVTSPSTTPTPDGLGTHIAEQGQPTAVPTEIYTSSPTTSPTSTSTETPTATATFTETSSPTATFTSTSSPTFTATATVPATSTPQSSYRFTYACSFSDTTPSASFPNRFYRRGSNDSCDFAARRFSNQYAALQPYSYNCSRRSFLVLASF